MRADALVQMAKGAESIQRQTRRLSDLVDRLLDKQRDDGGWSLPSLGTWMRSDGTRQETESDGYATALILHVLQTAGVPKDDVKIAKGLAWLERNQATTGAWRSVRAVILRGA